MKKLILAILLILTTGIAATETYAADAKSSSASPNVSPTILCLAQSTCCPLGPPWPVDCPANVWAPYGPLVQKLRFQYYPTSDYETSAFTQGQLDLMDGPVSCRIFACYSGPDQLSSFPQGSFDIYGIYFNGASSRFTASQESPTSPVNGPYWGCNWDTGTPFTSSEQTYVSACGVNMRQAFAHLIDRPKFAQNTRDPQTGLSLISIADPSPPAKDPSGSSLADQCNWDPLYPSSQYPTCLGAYNFADDPSGFATPSSLDFCAAADHMILAGIATGKNSMCVLTGVNPGVFAHPLRFVIRNDKPVRLRLGNGFMNALNQLMGGPAVITEYCRICTYPVVFSDPPIGPIDDWDAYTYGYGLVGPFADHLALFYDSSQATNYCGGTQNGFPDNPTFVCDPVLDQHLRAANSTGDVALYRTETLAAFNEYGKHAIDLPVYSTQITTAALASVDGLVNMRGIGYDNSWTILNAHKGTYVPQDPKYSFGGGDPTLLRYGQTYGTVSLNVFNAQIKSDFTLLIQVYDTLFTSSPVELGASFCWMCETYTQTGDSNGDTHFDVVLKPNLRWHDGPQVDAYDVKFSLLSLRDYAPYGFGYNLNNLKSVTVLSPSEVDIVFKGQNLSQLSYLGSAVIIPRHIWEDASQPIPSNWCCGSDVHPPDPAKLSYSYDPVAFGTLIGSGPFICRSVFPQDHGRIGTGCVTNADGSRGTQSVAPGGSILLQAFDRTSEPGIIDPFLQYMRSYNANWSTGPGTASQSGMFQEFHWADRYGNATVTVRDLTDVAQCYGKSAADSSCADYSHWNGPAFHPATPNTISSEVAIVSAHVDETWIYPYSWSGDQSAQPGPTLKNIVPFPP